MHSNSVLLAKYNSPFEEQILIQYLFSPILFNAYTFLSILPVTLVNPVDATSVGHASPHW